MADVAEGIYIDQGTFYADQLSRYQHTVVIPMNPTHFNFIHLHHLSHACTLITQPTTHYKQLMYFTGHLRYTYRSTVVHTHHITSSGVQLVLINNEPHDINMTVLSCPVQHTVPSVVSAVELGLHFRSQVADDIDMATRCSKVQGIGPTLHKGSITSEHKNFL